MTKAHRRQRGVLEKNSERSERASIERING